jgi:wyosine [tRNA(Phe)-imidazoG37] synthetase (radical SAM superfamily)
MQGKPKPLSVRNHDRDSAGMMYVYPVVSRRARGVSIGVNLNVNNACNWRCIYCQVPGLSRGGPPPVDLVRLRQELLALLADVLHGDFMQTRVPEGARRLNDIAVSGNGEPTSAREFGEVIDLIGEVRRAAGVPDEVKLVLITNGSLVHRPAVAAALARMRAMNGEVWFKLDQATDAAVRRVNGTSVGVERARRNIAIAAEACPTWVQTCLFGLDGKPPDEGQQQAYLAFLEERLAAQVPLQGVLLYGLARPSFQPEASRLSSLPEAWLDAFAERVRALGLPVKVAA